MDVSVDQPTSRVYTWYDRYGRPWMAYTSDSVVFWHERVRSAELNAGECHVIGLISECGVRGKAAQLWTLSASMTPLLRLGYTRGPVARTQRTSLATTRAVCSQLRRRFQSIRTMSTAKASADRPAPAVPRPSATVIVLNSRNEILLVQRNPKSKSFANAHVRPPPVPLNESVPRRGSDFIPGLSRRQL